MSLIVKLILVPLWPFFICMWVHKGPKGPLEFKGWVGGLLFFYFIMFVGAMSLLKMIVGERPKAATATTTPAPAPSAEVAK